MARKGGNKKRCERYRLSGHREENKRKRQARAQKRMEKFAARREAGKSYEYNKQHSIEKIMSEYEIDIEEYKRNKEFYDNAAKKDRLFISNKRSGKARDTEFSKWRGIERKLNDEVAQKKNEMKKLEKFKNRKSAE